MTTNSNEPEHELFKPLCNWTPSDMIKETLHRSAQHARTLAYSLMKKPYHSPFPALNGKHRSVHVAKDTVYCNTPVTDNGSTCAQLFVGTKTLLIDVYGMKSDTRFVNSLEDNVRQSVAMDKLTSDSTQSEISTREKYVLRALFVYEWKSEAYHQHQNFSERRYQTVKRQTNTLLDRTDAPAFT